MNSGERGLTPDAGELRAELERLRLQESALEESEARFHNLAEHLPGISIQGYTPDGTVVFWNRASEQVYGYAEKEAIGRNLADLIIPPDIRPHFDKALEIGRAATASGQFMPPGEIRLLHKKGHLVPVYSIHTVVLNPRGGDPMLYCIDVDLSERKQMERTIAELNDQLSRRVGHDLHDSVAQLLAGVTLLAHSLERGVFKKDAEAAELAHELACRTREALTQSRQLACELVPVAENEHGLVDALAQMVKEQRNASGVRCVLECDEALVIADHTVATELFHIAREALANALKHGAPGCVVVRLANENGMILLAIKDDGRGFDAGAPTTAGLGLKCMRYRASIIGGVMHITSQPGKGCTVVCSLPNAS